MKTSTPIAKGAGRLPLRAPAVTTSKEGASTVPPRRGRRATTIDGPDPVDLHVGARVRLRRLLLGLSQSQLGDAIGMTFQQVQKYEKGANRISASMLHRISHVLHIPISFFFDAMPDTIQIMAVSDVEDVLIRPESADVLLHYYQIPESLRLSLLQLLKAMARRR